MLPLLWLCGTSGVGKSTVGWLLQRALRQRGIDAAFIDADQLRNASGVDATEDDFIADGLRSVEPGFRAAGASLLIVAGIVDDPEHLERLLPGRERRQARVVYLRASDGEVLSRVERRGWNVELGPESVAYARRFDTRWVDAVVDTTSRDAADVAEELAGMDLIAAPPPETDGRSPREAGEPPRMTVLTGPGGVGLSTSGFLAYLRLAWAGAAVGYIDSHQLGFLGESAHPPAGSALRATNAVRLASSMARRGVRHVVMTADPRTVHEVAALTSGVRVVWLDASDRALASRHHARARGEGPPLVGDHRRGLGAAAIRDGVERAIRESRDPSARPTGAEVIDTTDLRAEEVADRIADLIRTY